MVQWRRELNREPVSHRLRESRTSHGNLANELCRGREGNEPIYHLWNIHTYTPFSWLVDVWNVAAFVPRNSSLSHSCFGHRLESSVLTGLSLTGGSQVSCNPGIRGGLGVVPEMTTVNWGVGCGLPHALVFRQKPQHVLSFPFITDHSFAGVLWVRFHTCSHHCGTTTRVNM